MAKAQKLKIHSWNPAKLIPYARNPRKNDEAVEKMAAAIVEFGFRIPIIARSDGIIVDGHLRYKAAQYLGLTEIPVILADDLTEAQVKAFRLLANRSANWAEWDNDLLKLELEELQELDFPLSMTGFDEGEITELIALPDFKPADIDEQGLLDETTPASVTCPNCGHEFETRSKA